MHKTTRIGVIGVGRMGQAHCRIYSNLRGAQLVGVCDSNPEQGNRLAQRYDVPYYQTVDELLDHVDAVSLVTPTPYHYDLAVKCIEHGVHVMIEKPVTETEEQACNLKAKAENSGLVIQVGHIERFNPAYTELKNVVEDMQILAVSFRRLSAYSGSNTDVDVVLDLMIHDADLALDLAGKAPLTISGAGIYAHGKAVDYAIAQLRFDPGPLMTFMASRITEGKVRSIEITSLNAYVEANLLNKTLTVHRGTFGQYLNNNSKGVKYRQEGLIESIVVPVVEPLFAELQHFVDCVQEGRQPLVTIDAGLKALSLAISIRDACQANSNSVASIPVSQPAELIPVSSNIA